MITDSSAKPNPKWSLGQSYLICALGIRLSMRTLPKEYGNSSHTLMYN